MTILLVIINSRLHALISVPHFYFQLDVEALFKKLKALEDLTVRIMVILLTSISFSLSSIFRHYEVVNGRSSAVLVKFVRWIDCVEKLRAICTVKRIEVFFMNYLIAGAELLLANAARNQVRTGQHSY